MRRLSIWALAFLIASCSHGGNRAPSSEEPAGEGDPLALDTPLYTDFFTVDTGGKRLKYRMDFRFHTDMDKEHLRTRAFAAFQTALAKTLSTNEATLAARLKKNVMESVLEEFVYTLYVLKIINGTIQADIHFFPVNDSPYDLTPELDNNNLVLGDQKGKLALQLEEIGSKTDTQRIAAAMKNEVVRARDDSGDYKYLGGSVSLWIKIADLRWNPLEKFLPDPKKNAVKGFLRFRRHYLAEPMRKSGLDCGGGLRLKELRFGPTKDGGDAKQFVTVDVYKDFNLGSLLPKNESADVYFGLLLPTNKGRSRLLPGKDWRTGEAVKTGELRIVAQGPGADEYTHRVGGLTYSFASKSFDFSRSSVKSEAAKQDPEAGSAAYFAGKELLKQCENTLFQEFSLNRFFRSEP